MSDLADRLRSGASMVGPSAETALPGVEALLNEAAARIEYLESVAGAVSHMPPESASAYAKARRESEDWLRGVEKGSGDA